MVGRRIAISYTSFAVGRGLMALAKERVLTQADTVYIVHVFTQRNEVLLRACTAVGACCGRAAIVAMW